MRRFYVSIALLSCYWAQNSSQGFGCTTGVGVMTDTGRGVDTYINGPGRANGVNLVEPATACGTAALPGVGLFSDRPVE